MNLFKKTAVLGLCLGFVLSFSSCVVAHHHTHVVEHDVARHDNGKHKGWYKVKKSNNNSGNSNGNGHGNKGKKHGKH